MQYLHLFLFLRANPIIEVVYRVVEIKAVDKTYDTLLIHFSPKKKPRAGTRGCRMTKSYAMKF